MITWTDSAREILERYTASIRGPLAATGADPDEVAADLRRHIEEELAASKILIATGEDVQRLVTRFGPVVADKPGRKGPGLAWKWPLAAAILAAILFAGWRSHFRRVYSASSTLLFEIPVTVVRKDGVRAAYSSSSGLGLNLEVYAETIRSDKIRRLVRQNLTPAENLLLEQAAKKNLLSPDRLGRVTVAGGDGGTVLRIAVESGDPEAAAVVANKFVETFMDYSEANLRDTADFAANFLQTQADKLKAEAASDSARVKQLRDAGVAGDAPEMQAAVAQKDVAESNYRALLKRLEQTRESRAPSRLPARPLDAARPDPNPVAPSARTVLRQSLLAGVAVLFAGSLLAWAVQRRSAGASGSAKAT
ncbi:MAG TPA: hypothetical protein VHC86_16660 [Opitutaceae bacterium]|nr:hypothetical protein [Opitutaceae bacterium]